MTAPSKARTLLLDKMNAPPQRRRVVAAPARKAPAELQSVRVIYEEDPDPDVSYLDQSDLADRKTAFKKGEFNFVGVRVDAEVLIAETVQTLTSPGMWGIESDTTEEELEQLVSEEWGALRAVLKTVGVPTEQLPLDVQREWIEWRT